jgi:hypothetical protein
MNYAVLYRLAGVAALSGGLLRIASALPLSQDAATLEWLYTGIDILLLFGFIVAVAALSFIGGPDADPFGFSTYEQGAAALAIALVGLSMAWVRTGERPWGPPICWFASVIIAGVLGYIPPLSAYGMPAAGALFGLGFVLASMSLLRPRT